MVARLVRDQKVAGSNPVTSTTEPILKTNQDRLFLCPYGAFLRSFEAHSVGFLFLQAKFFAQATRLRAGSMVSKWCQLTPSAMPDDLPSLKVERSAIFFDSLTLRVEGIPHIAMAFNLHVEHIVLPILESVQHNLHDELKAPVEPVQILVPLAFVVGTYDLEAILHV